MTKEEAIRLVSNTRVYVGTKSEEIQRKLFELGFKWGNGKEVMYLDKPFLYINVDSNSAKVIRYGEAVTSFNESSFKELTAEEIISIKIENKPTFKPFDKVLVRDGNGDNWKCSFYSHYTEKKIGYSHATIDSYYSQCIPFEGNEHLVGTCNTPCKKD